jgi:phosphate transport system substrate-binding protein
MKNKFNQFFSLFFIATVSLFIVQCGGGGSSYKKYSDTATYGSAMVCADESYKIIIEQEADAFMATYTDANVIVNYLPEGELLKMLMASDSCRFAVMSRKLTAEELKYFKETLKLTPQELKIAYDAVAIIINKENAADSATISQLKDILSGQINTWNQLGGKPDSVVVVFDNKQSGNARFIKEQLLNNSDKFPANCYAVNSNEDVINYVYNHPNSMGIIGVNWVSDKDDSTSQQIMTKIKMMAVAADSMPGNYVKPYQAYIAQKTYPLVREVYIIKREARTGLGTGFASYIAGDKGQRIILKAGLVPATMPVRIIQVNNE